MRVKLPNLEGKAMFDYLKQNKSRLIAEKCSLPIESDPFLHNTVPTKSGIGTKAEGDTPDNDRLLVKVVGNTALFADSYLDVLSPDSWKKTISERGPGGKNLVYHLRDHKSNFDGQIGEPKKLYTENIKLDILGYSGTGTAPALVMESEVVKDYSDVMFTRYMKGAVKQHSIGFQYVKLELAINDADYKEEFAVWGSHYDQIFNKEVVDKANYFWWVSEIKLYEISAVLFGANELTPTLEVSSQPSEGTGKNDKTDTEPNKLTPDQIKTRILLTNFID